MPNLNTHVRSDFTDHILLFLEKRFLERLVKEFHLVPLGMPKTHGRNQGLDVKFNRFDNPVANITALTDGVSPDGSTLTSATVTATLQQFGDFVSVSDQLQLAAINDTMKDAADLLSYKAALSLDTLARNELDTNGTQQFADGAITGGANASKNDVTVGTDTLRSDELRGVLKEFRISDVPPFADGMYRGVIHPLMEFDLISESAANAFVVLAANTTNQVQEKGEIGVAYNIKLLRSTNIRADVTETNVYGNIFLGRNAFGTIWLVKNQVEMIVHPAGDAGSEDPLNQRSTVGYKFWYVAKVLEAVRAQIVHAFNAG